MSETVPGHAEMLPCPFCGGEAEIERRGDYRASTIYQCQNCSCRLETGETWGFGNVWNRRTPIAAHGAGAVTEAMVERALHSRVPGGSEVWVWIAQDDAFVPSQNARDVVRAALEAALRPDEAAGQGEALPRDDTGRVTSDYEPSPLEVKVARDAICREFGSNGTDGYYIRILKAIEAARRATPRPEASGAPDIVPVAWAYDEFYVGHGGVQSWHSRVSVDRPHDGRLDIRNVQPLYGPDAIAALRAEAARLKDENKKLVAGLEPFAKMADQVDEWQKGKDPNFSGHFDTNDLRRARSLTAAKGG